MKKDRRDRMQVRIKKSVKDKVKSLAKTKAMTFSEYVRQIIFDHIAHFADKRF